MIKWFVFFLALTSSSAFAIINGVAATGNEGFAKSVVGLGVKADDGFHIFCSASLIDSKTIITAAHCFYDRDEGGIYAVFGLSENGAGTEGRLITTKKADAIHEKYIPVHMNGDVDIFDVALAQFEGQLPAGYHALPLLPEDLREGADVILAGYGFSSFDLRGLPTASGTLHYTTVKVADAHSAKTEIATDEQNSGTCGIDSGGPGIIQVTGEYYLWGATSRGNSDCVGGQGIYSKVTSYRDWIAGKLQSWNARPRH